MTSANKYYVAIELVRAAQRMIRDSRRRTAMLKERKNGFHQHLRGVRYQQDCYPITFANNAARLSICQYVVTSYEHKSGLLQEPSPTPLPLIAWPVDTRWHAGGISGGCSTGKTGGFLSTVTEASCRCRVRRQYSWGRQDSQMHAVLDHYSVESALSCAISDLARLGLRQQCLRESGVVAILAHLKQVHRFRHLGWEGRMVVCFSGDPGVTDERRRRGGISHT